MLASEPNAFHKLHSNEELDAVPVEQPAVTEMLDSIRNQIVDYQVRMLLNVRTSRRLTRLIMCFARFLKHPQRFPLTDCSIVLNNCRN